MDDVNFRAKAEVCCDESRGGEWVEDVGWGCGDGKEGGLGEPRKGKSNDAQRMIVDELGELWMEKRREVSPRRHGVCCVW